MVSATADHGRIERSGCHWKQPLAAPYMFLGSEAPSCLFPDVEVRPDLMLLVRTAASCSKLHSAQHSMCEGAANGHGDPRSKRGRWRPRTWGISRVEERWPECRGEAADRWSGGRRPSASLGRLKKIVLAV